MKRIVICCDGTWSKPGTLDRGQQVATNVEKIYNLLPDHPAVPQVKYYGQGIGTGFSLTDRLFGGSFGLGIDNSIRDAYKFIMWSYEPGDELYFFGFSRGAYTVRSLVGLINNCGILRPEFLHLVGEAYHLYRSRTAITHPDSDHMKAFKKSYGREATTPIHFLGVWDTVGSLGIPFSWLTWWNRRHRFHDVKLSRNVKYAYHALAVDERRKYFEPALWEASKGATERTDPQVVEQVWFPGVHCNVGGGYVDCGLSNISLKWMVDKAAAAGLLFNPELVQALKGDSTGELRNSVTGIFRLTPKALRTINSASSQSARIRNEKIHYSCLERAYHLQQEYKPVNLQSAIKADTFLDPEKTAWLPDWQPYLRLW